jgi:hypothetical protein
VMSVLPVLFNKKQEKKKVKLDSKSFSLSVIGKSFPLIKGDNVRFRYDSRTKCELKNVIL